MKNDLETDDITLLIAQARKHRSDAAGELIANGGRKTLVWLATRGNRLLHTLLMSPIPQQKTH